MPWIKTFRFWGKSALAQKQFHDRNASTKRARFRGEQFTWLQNNTPTLRIRLHYCWSSCSSPGVSYPSLNNYHKTFWPAQIDSGRAILQRKRLRCVRGGVSETFLPFITPKPRVERYTKSTSLKYEPASEPLHISVK